MKITKLSSIKTLQAQIAKAVKEGRLQLFCFGAYGEPFARTQCQDCPYREICKQEEEAIHRHEKTEREK